LTAKGQHLLSASKHFKKKIHGKEKGELKGYKEFFVQPRVE
jgi:hypothetical protein